MNVIRWEPFSAMNDMLNRFPAWFGPWPRLPATFEPSNEWAPSVDISETEGEYLIRASLPGVKKEDTKVTIEDGMLTLSGERQQQEELKDEKFHKVESFYGSFSRSFALPDAVNEKAIKADSKDGVLTVHVPKIKVEAKEPTKIAIQ
ncbi:MAG TPA: Hsp20/alpha crystallin family protein [Steroidobacteraceae bacterium]|nr:Hsp20/alpha crystallin family protein [Steroidobacteraceae bacterium]